MRRKRMQMQKLDPNWKFASQHGQASRPGIQNSSSNASRRNSILMCPCCLNVIHKEPVSLWQSPKELSFLGFGFPLFYNMIQYCLISLFLLILSQSSILLYLSINETCTQSQTHRLLASSTNHNYNYPCQSTFVILARVSQDIHSQDPFDRIIRSLSFIAQFVLMIYFRDVQRKLACYHLQRNTRIKDFSIIFRNLPKVPGIQRTLKQFLISLDPKIKVHQIFLMPKIDYFHDLQLQKLQIIDHMKRIIKQQKFSHSMKLSLQAQLQRVNIQLLQTCKKIESQYKQDQLFTTKAIIILQTKQQKVIALKKFKKLQYEELQKYFRWMADQITMDSAPQPRQIIWSNINYPKYRRWLRILLGWVLSALFLGFVTLIFYFLLVVKSESHSLGILIIILLLVQFFNKFIMKMFLHLFSDLQMPETSSDRQFSYAFKYTIGMFFTTAIMSLLVQAIVYNNVIYQYGIVQNQTIMFFFNAFIVNLIWLFHPQYYIHKLKRWYYYGVKNITQKQANDLMQDYPYDMGKRYAQVLQTMWFTFLYASLIPIGAFLSFIGFCIYYWVDKYNLLRRSKIQNSIQSQLPIKAVKLLELTLLWKPLGQLLFDLKIRGDYHLQTLIMIGIGTVSLFVPWDSILDFFFHQNFNVSKQTYNDVKYGFTQTYQTVDPIQRTLALQKFIQGQNKGRMKKNQFNQKESHTILQIRQYNDDNKSEKRSQNRYHIKTAKDTEQIDMSTFQINLKPGRSNSELY